MKYYSLLHTYTWKHWVVTYGLVALFSCLPLLLAVFGLILKQVLGCGSENDGMAGSCPGGGIISVLFTIGWLSLVTLPFGGFVIALLAVAHVLWYLKKKSGQE